MVYILRKRRRQVGGTKGAMLTYLVFKSWIATTAGLVSLAWILSFFQKLSWVETLGPIWILFVVIWTARGLKGLRRSMLLDVKIYTVFWPFIVLLGLIFTAAIIYPPTVHDSLSYRLPRIFMWLEHDRIFHFPASDDRLNYMPANWGLVSMPFIRTFEDRLLAWPNIISWILVYLFGLSVAKKFTADHKLQKWGALVGVSTNFAVLQACRSTDDLFVVALLLISVWFLIYGNHHISNSSILWSGMALSLAAGCKPHFSVLAIFWIGAVIYVYPWRQTPILHLWRVAMVAPVVLLVSPLPFFVLNHITYGSVLGSSEESQMSAGAPWERVSAAAVMSGWYNFQPPLNPLAKHVNEAIASSSSYKSVQARLPKFLLGAGEVPLVDGAALGLFSSLLWLLGVALAWIYRDNMPPSFWYLVAVGVVGFVMSAAVVMPSSLARSFMGFMYLALPLITAALVFAKPAVLKGIGSCAVVSSVLVLILTPANPLWPAKTVAAWAERHHPKTNFAALLSRYASFQDRYGSGAELVALVPPTSRLLVVTGAGEPLLQIVRGHRSVVFLGAGESLTSSRLQNVDYVLVGGLGFEVHPRAVYDLSAFMLPVELVAKKQFVSRLRDGPLEWVLFKVLREAPSRGSKDLGEEKSCVQ